MRIKTLRHYLMPGLLFLGGLLAFSTLHSQAFESLSQVPSLPNYLQSRCQEYVLLDFYSPYCSACVMWKPYVDKIAKDFKGQVRVLHINVDKEVNRPFARKYQIRYTPSYFLFDSKGDAVIDMASAGNPNAMAMYKKLEALQKKELLASADACGV